jgi:hypothetical protein
MGGFMKLTIDFLKRPTVTCMEASMLLGISVPSIKRRIADGRIKALERTNLKEKVLIYTKSLAKYLQEAE